MVIEGGFKPHKEPTEHSGKRLMQQITDSGVLDLATGTFSLCFDSGDSVFILSNGEGAGSVLLNFKKAEIALMASTYDEEGG
jgi:hypothetical protein